MKISIYSQTGKPTDVDAAMEFEKEFKAEYDRLWELKKSEIITIDEMRIKLGELDEFLKSKYKMDKVIDMPKTGKAWKDLVLAIGYPITIAVKEEDHKLALFIMDSEY
jgi:hypothetical protein